MEGETNRHEDEFILEASDVGGDAAPEAQDDKEKNELLSLYDGIHGAKEEREKVGIYTEWARAYLERYFGVNDLSDIEGVHLRNTVEQLLPKVEQEREMVLEGKMEAMNFAEMEEEAPALWLYNLYGIHPKDIPHVLIVEDDTTGQTQTFEMTMKDRARELEADLQAQGHRAYIIKKIPQDFKDYLKHIRQEAHKP